MRRPLAPDRYADHRPRLVLVVADLVTEGADVPERAYLGGRRRLIALGAFVAVAAAVTACTAPSTPETSPSPSGALIIPAAPEGALPEETQAQLQQALDDTVAEYGVPGAAVGVWLPDEGSWTTAVGLADVDAGVAASVDMQWPLRSVTKSFTVTLLLELVDEGDVSLDDTIDQYVDGVTDGDRITLRELANMSSGNADYTNDKFVAAFSADPSKIFTLDELNGFMLGEPARFEPGTEHVYTNANTNLLGAVVEEVTGESFGNVVEERILEPLQLEDTRYTLDVSTWEEPHPIGYVLDEGEPAPQPDNLSIFGPAGSMVATVDDMRVWGIALATGALLTPETQAQRLEGTPLEVGPPYDIYALGIGETDGWWGHNGEGLGFTAAVFHNPDTAATVAVFMNLSNVQPKAHPADQLFRRIAAVLQG
jgi:D-alanyl-D-alanine carboxypeptidase